MTPDDTRRYVAELLGTALLLVAVVGSGIVVGRAGADAGTQLFQHALVVGITLAALIVTLGPVSGAHFNPVVTAADWWFGGLPARRALGYGLAQVVGAVLGVVVTHAMFGETVLALSANPRASAGVAVGEVVATGGLLLVIFGLVRSDAMGAVPAAVGAWVAGAIVFTSSACFANPAVTIARSLTDTWTGIAPGSVPLFLAAQVVGGAATVVLVRWLYAPTAREATDVLVPHDADPVDLESRR